MKAQCSLRNDAADFCRQERTPAWITSIANRAAAFEESALVTRAGGDARTALRMERRADRLWQKHKHMVASCRVTRAFKDALKNRHRIVTKIMDDTQEALLRVAKLRGVDPARMASMLLAEAVYAVDAMSPTGHPSTADFILNAAPSGMDPWGTRRAKRMKEIGEEVRAVEAVLAKVTQ